VHATGHTGFHRALAQAARDLRSGAVSAALVGAVDSLIDPAGLARLADSGRLKTPLDPAGLQPGEAAGFVWLDAVDPTSPAASPALATVRALAFAQEEYVSFADGAPTGRAIASAMRDAVSHLSISRFAPVWALSDLNGEAYRATDWGNALVHTEAGQNLRLSPGTLYPAASMGDTGAASGVIALCIAAAAFARGWAPAQTAALVSASDAGERSALLVQAA
jgi:3-oxoacyl-[acyl-carrier-protein] synthase-1